MRCRFLPRRSPRVAAALAAVAALGLAAPARADVITTFSNVSPGEVVTITSNGVSETGWAGQYNFIHSSGDITGPFGGFCIDVSQSIYGGLTVQFKVAGLASAPNDNNSPSSAMGALRANLVEELWYNDHPAALLNASNAAAFQIAVWEIINETSVDSSRDLALDVSSGSFSVKDANADGSTTLATANAWLHGIDVTGAGPRDTSLIALTSPTYQDYVTSVPAPSGLVLAGLAALSGALAAGWRRLRRCGGQPTA